MDSRRGRSVSRFFTFVRAIYEVVTQNVDNRGDRLTGAGDRIRRNYIIECSGMQSEIE